MTRERIEARSDQPGSANPPELRRPFMQEREEMASQLATTDDALPAEVIDVSGGLLGVIARAARDPSVDIDKMERLMEMQERVIAREAKTAYAVALAQLQPLLPVISERGKILNKQGETQSTYAYWEDVNEQIRPLLSEAGFSLSFRTGRAGSEITVTGVLTHREGHSEETTITLPADGSGNKNAVQAVASSTSYGKRYTAFALLNITTKGEDDDGTTATNIRAPAEPTRQQRLRDAPFPQGPCKNKTELKARGREFWREVEGCGDPDELAALLSSGGALTKQLAEALPDWWNGGTKDGEPYPGLATVIARKQTEFAADAQQDGDWRNNPLNGG